MMITIHGLAPKTKYQDVKLLIKQECNIDDFILDYLVNDGDGTKKVRIGLPNENEGFKLMKCLNGYRMPDNSVLKVVPVGKPVVNPEVTSQEGYDSRPGYQNQSRNDYPTQPRGEYINQSSSNDYHRGPHGPGGPRGPGGPHGSGRPHGPGGPHGPSRPHGPGGPHGSSRPHGPGEHHGSVGHQRPNAPHGSNKPYGSGGPWSANNSNSSQWTSNLSMAAQVPQNTFGYGTVTQPNVPQSYTEQQGHSQHLRPDIRPFDQARPAAPVEQNYGGYPPKNNVPAGRQSDLRQNLRSVDSLEPVNPGPAPMHSSRYPPNQYPQEKPGPTQYNINHPAGHQQQYPQQAAVSPWQQQGHQTQQLKPQFSKASPIGYEKGFEDRKYPQSEQARDPKNTPRPDTYKEYEKRRGFSPSARDPLPRRLSPSRREDPIHSGPPTRVGDMGQRMGDPIQRRDDLHARRDDPHVRRDEPHVRRFSPTRKRTPPGERRNIPGARHESPHKRPSPTRRIVSPGRRDERPIPRFSPVRHHPEKGDKYGSDAKDLKKVRPAYDPVPSHAPNQAMYSGGFRPNIHENDQYPIAGMRQEQSGPWQRHRDEPPISMKKQDEERRDSRMQMSRDRMSDQVDKHFSPARKSRSPNRRNRSPIRDRFKRNSPSPRSSYSPRRSWALEKRRSPDAPPPPSWPGQNTDLNRPARPNFPEKDEKPKHQPVWEPRSFKEDDIRSRRIDDRRPYEEAKLRIAKDLMERPPASQMAGNDQYQREPKFSPRNEYEERRDNYRRRESPERKPHRDDFNLQRRPREEGGPDDYNRRRESPHRDRKPDLPKEIDKDFEDIYHRALQLKKKTEELRKSASKKRDEFDDDRRHSDKERDEMRQRYEDRARFREDELLRLREREERRDDRPRDDRLQDERPRDDRPRDNRPREERMRDDRPRHDDDHRGEYDPRDNHGTELDKAIDDNKIKRHFFTNNAVREKRSKAIQEISEKIIDRNEDFKHVQGGQRQLILEELKLAVARIIYDMFGDSDVSFIEIIIKYQARYTLKDEVKILQDVMRSMPKKFRTIKRHGPESTAVPAKTSRHSPIADMKQGRRPAPLPVRPKPSHPIIKKIPHSKPELRPAKPVVKSNMSEGQALKVTNKPAVSTNNIEQVRKQETKKQEEVMKDVKFPTTSEQAGSGHYQLNGLMTRMVDAELQDIMSKIWHELPDASSTEAECFIVDTLKNKASHDLRNVLGLNVTKRLLNVHNPLYVKVKFNGKPGMEDLREFLKKYNFTAFARKAVNIFAAQVRSIDDFDRICGDSDVRCGNVKVTVSPVYRFTTCPQNLKTNYKEISMDGIEADSIDNDIEMKDVKDIKKEKIETSINPNISLTKPAEQVLVKVKEEKPANVQVVAPKVDPKQVNKSSVKNNDIGKPIEAPNKPIQSTEATPKPEPPKIVKTVNKVNTTKSEMKVTIQESTKIVSPTKVATATIITPTKVTTAATITPTKVTTATKVTPTKPVTKAPLQKSTKVEPKRDVKVEDDYDELDDHDILAMMSEGIILDECSGSEGE